MLLLGPVPYSLRQFRSHGFLVESSWMQHSGRLSAGKLCNTACRALHHTAIPLHRHDTLTPSALQTRDQVRAMYDRAVECDIGIPVRFASCGQAQSVIA